VRSQPPCDDFMRVDIPTPSRLCLIGLHTTFSSGIS